MSCLFRRAMLCLRACVLLILLFIPQAATVANPSPAPLIHGGGLIQAQYSGRDSYA